MALTLAGRRLTADHKREQLLLAHRLVLGSRLLLAELNPYRLDATREEWRVQQLALFIDTAQRGQHLSLDYLDQYRFAEVNGDSREMPLMVTALDLGEPAELFDLIPAKTKKLSGLGMAPQAAVDRAFWSLMGAMKRQFLDAGRDAIDASVRANEASIGWRRVSDGNPCAFCAMLVSRGPVYGHGSATLVTGRNGRTRGTRRMGEKFHDSCGCTCEEVFGHWTPTAEEQRYVDLYHAAHQPGMTGGETAAAMRAQGQGVVNDAHKPKTQTGGDGSGKPPPPRGVSLTPGHPEWGYWRERQQALGIEAHGEELEPREIIFVERFQALGHRLEWLPTDRVTFLPTNDFLWLTSTSNHEWELKSTTATYKAIKARVQEDAIKGKRRFVVDIDASKLSPALRRQLGDYNRRVKQGRIEALYVMSENGQVFEEIELIPPE